MDLTGPKDKHSSLLAATSGTKKKGFNGTTPQVVHFAISLLVSWVFSDEDGIESALFSSNGLPAW
jgi:hypothetical protein